MPQPEYLTLSLPPIPYYITTGMAVYQPGEQHPNRRNIGIFDLLWVVKGTLFIGENDTKWEVSEGQTLLLLPDRDHYAVKPCERETVFYWNHFDFAGSWRQTADPADPAPGGASSAVRHAWANPYTLRLRQYASPPQFALAERHLHQLLAYAGERRSAAYWNEQQLFMELLQLLEDGHTAAGGASPAMQLAERTEAYLRQHYQAVITNESLAAALHFHPNYVVRCMKAAYQCSPMEFLHRYRLEQAKLLLIKTERPVAYIAEQVGFPYAPYFSTCFKMYTGVSPLKFRKQYSP